MRTGTDLAGMPGLGRRHTRVSTRALAAVLVPIVGLGVVASSIVHASQRRAHGVRQATVAIERFLTLDQLMLQVRSELDLAATIAEERSTGVDVAAMSELFGADVEALYQRSRAGAEKAQTRLRALPSEAAMVAEVDDARQQANEIDVSATTLRASYDGALTSLDLAARRARSDVWRALADVGEAGDISALVSAVAYLDDYHRLVATELGELSRRSLPTTGTSRASAVDLDANHASQSGALKLIGGGLPEPYATRWRSLLGSIPFVRFASLRNSITADTAPRPGSAADAPLTVVGDLFGAGLERNDAVVAFIETLGNDVRTATTRIGTTSSRRVGQLTFLLALLGVVALTITITVVRGLTTPLHRLLDVAREIASGHLAVADVPRRGPREIVELAEVVGVLSHNLAAIDAHARALAEGRLDDASIPSSLPGGIGSLLQVTMDRLVDETTRLSHQARHDPLTGLYNRGAILAELDDVVHRARRGDPATVVFVDLDGFKAVNDRFGHDVGDELLRAVAERLERAAAEQHRVGRLGGDEFVIIARGVDDTDELGSRLLGCFAAPFALSVGLVPLKASIGMSRCEGSLDAADILRRADQAAYEAKRSGKARVVVS